MTGFTSRYGSPADDYRGVHIWTHSRHSTTVVAVAGSIDSANVGHIADHVDRFVTPDTPLVLDLSAVTESTPEVLGLLDAIDQQCANTGVQWALVAAEPVAGSLTAEADYLVAGSVTEAEQWFDDAILSRRRGLLPLFAKSA